MTTVQVDRRRLVALLVFDDGWVEHPTVWRGWTRIARTAAAVAIIIAAMAAAFAVAYGLLQLLAWAAAPTALLIGLPSVVTVGAVVLVGNRWTWFAVQALVATIADRWQRSRHGPIAGEPRRKPGVPWNHRARSATEFAACFDNAVAVTRTELAGVRLHPEGAVHVATVWLHDGSMREYRSGEAGLPGLLLPFTGAVVPLARPSQLRRLLLGGLVVAVLIGTLIAALALIPVANRFDSRQLTRAPDTAAPARGSAQQLTDALRAQGYVCSDENIDPALLSRVCGRVTPDTRGTVTFVADARPGTLQRVKVNVLPDGEPPHAYVDAVSAVGASSAMSSEEQGSLLAAARAGQSGRFAIGAWTLDVVSDGSLELQRTAWRVPQEDAATLGGDFDRVEQLARSRGYACVREEYSLECTRKSGSDEFKLVANETASTTRQTQQGPARLKRLYVGVTAAGSQAIWVEEMTGFLDGLPGPEAAALATWIRANPRVEGADAFVAGLRWYVRTSTGDRITTGDAGSPCWPSRSGPFC